MKLVHYLRHLFIPHESNNQKASLLHSSSIALLIVGFLFYQLALEFIPALHPQILGYAANIPPSEVIRLTNEKRVANGLAPLTDNPTLDAAAQAKGADMLNKGYWAHIAPDGTTPWAFFTNFGYQYRYAGENLARDFSSPGSTVDAWMASPSHRENLLSPRYKEIGVAVVEGSLAGVDTTIVVQFFGTKYGNVLPTTPVASTRTKGPVRTLAPVTLSEAQPTPAPVRALISPFTATKSLSLIVIWVLMAVLAIDLIVVARRRIERVGGRSFAHLSFLGMILAIIIIAKAGQIL